MEQSFFFAQPEKKIIVFFFCWRFPQHHCLRINQQRSFRISCYIIRIYAQISFTSFLRPHSDGIETDHHGLPASAFDQRVKWGRNDLSGLVGLGMWVRCHVIRRVVSTHDDKNWPRSASYLRRFPLDRAH